MVGGRIHRHSGYVAIGQVEQMVALRAVFVDAVVDGRYVEVTEAVDGYSHGVSRKAGFAQELTGRTVESVVDRHDPLRAHRERFGARPEHREAGTRQARERVGADGVVGTVEDVEAVGAGRVVDPHVEFQGRFDAAYVAGVERARAPEPGERGRYPGCAEATDPVAGAGLFRIDRFVDDVDLPACLVDGERTEFDAERTGRRAGAVEGAVPGVRGELASRRRRNHCDRQEREGRRGGRQATEERGRAHRAPFRWAPHAA